MIVGAGIETAGGVGATVGADGDVGLDPSHTGTAGSNHGVPSVEPDVAPLSQLYLCIAIIKL